MVASERFTSFNASSVGVDRVNRRSVEIHLITNKPSQGSGDLTLCRLNQRVDRSRGPGIHAPDRRYLGFRRIARMKHAASGRGVELQARLLSLRVLCADAVANLAHNGAELIRPAVRRRSHGPCSNSP